MNNNENEGNKGNEIRELKSVHLGSHQVAINGTNLSKDLEAQYNVLLAKNI